MPASCSSNPCSYDPLNGILLNKTRYDVGRFKHCELSQHCVHLTSIAAHPVLRKTGYMLMYLFNCSCIYSISSYMYKRTTADIERNVVHVKLV